MIIQEDFDKLKQNDRIEFLLRDDRLDKKKENSYFNWGALNWLFIAVVFFLIILAFQFEILENIEMVGVIILIAKIIIIVSVVNTIFGIILNQIHNLIIFPKWDKKLESYFFEEEKKKPKK